jgi:hypothetical protein
MPMFEAFYDFESRDQKIRFENNFKSFYRLINNLLTVIVVTYIFGLLWYRWTDHLVPEYFSNESEERSWVVEYGMRGHHSAKDDGLEVMDVKDRLMRSMYFIMTTLGTVGYGDYVS